jgi:hypothetical protein
LLDAAISSSSEMLTVFPEDWDEVVQEVHTAGLMQSSCRPRARP